MLESTPRRNLKGYCDDRGVAQNDKPEVSVRRCRCVTYPMPNKSCRIQRSLDGQAHIAGVLPRMCCKYAMQARRHTVGGWR
eukprot:18947-Eustigmatos_ZCMA.PRE.1